MQQASTLSLQGSRVLPEPSAFLVEAIHECEQQLREITDELLAHGSGDNSVEPIFRISVTLLRRGWESSVL